MPAATHEGYTAAVIESGRVLDVDIQNYSLTVTTQYPPVKPLVGISFCTPYQHFENGEGIYFMPEVGSIVWICFPSDGSRPFVIGWAPAREANAGFRSNKRDLNPGDIYLGTRDDNFIILRRGGVVQIGGGPLCQRMFLPINNTIRDFAENYLLSTLAGDLEWTIDREETTTDGKRPGHVRLKAREFANDPQPVAVLEIGSHGENSPTILSLTINASGQDGAAKKITVELRKDGTARFDFKGDVTLATDGDLSISTKKNLTLSAKLAASLEGQSVKVKSQTTVDVEAAAAMNLKASAVNVAAQLVVTGPGGGGGSKVPMMVASPAVLAYLLGHTHTSAAPGVQTSPPVGAAITGTDHISKKIFG